MRRLHVSKILIVLILPALISCSSHIYETAFPTLVDGKYDSEFPYNSSSRQLEEIGNSVKMVNTLSFYTANVFREENDLHRNELTEEIIDKYSLGSSYFNQTASGTATIISSSINSVVLLTCAHIVDFPDTIVSYYPNNDGGYSDIVQSIAVKEKQTIWIIGLPERGEIDLLAADKDLDIALLGKIYRPVVTLNLDPFKYPVGEAKQLDWGSFVYVFGYPLNYKMITKGIVSSPNKDSKGTFLIDAVFNKGYSGGIVLAIRDGVPNFEMVGMIKSVPSEIEYILKPAESDDKQSFNPNVPYTGEIFVEQKSNLKYGITKVIPIETILEFISTEKDRLANMGYDCGCFAETK